jgi:serine/threonine protein phosphatase PrpC
MKCAIAQETHIGRRPSNQDRLGHWRTPEAILLAAADGMGGHAHGEYAAELALRYAAAGFRRDARARLADPAAHLRRALLGAHAALLQQAHALGLEDTPRTTIVACVVQQGWAWWAHVGDSRQCLGGVQAPRVEAVGRARLERDDVLLLCTDGFWEPLHERQILAGLESGSLAEGVARLAGLARERAGAESDNISALALAWEEAAVPLAEGVVPGPRLEPVSAAERIDAPDPDILRAMDEER